MSTFLDLPNEVLIEIATHLAILDVFNLRQTCKRCFHLTCERSIWEAILQAQSAVYPMPPSIKPNMRTLNVETRDMEMLATSVHTAAASWLRHRSNALPFQSNAISDWSSSGAMAGMDGLDHRSIQDMHMLLDRWLVVVFQEGCYELWDLYPTAENAGTAHLSPKGTWAKGRVRPVCVLQEKVHGSFISSAACIDPEDDSIILALSSQPVIVILKINLKARQVSPQILASIGTTPFSVYIMRAIEPTSKLLVFGFALNLHFWHWPTDSYWEVQLDPNEEEIYNLIIAAHFLTPRHLICVLSSSVELLTLDFIQEVQGLPPTQRNQTLRLDALNFLGRRNPSCIQVHHPNPADLVNMRGAEFSQTQMTTEEGRTTFKTTFLAYNVLRGLFHYAVEARFPVVSNASDAPSPSSNPHPTTYEFNDPPLDLTVELLAHHHMARYVPPSNGVARVSRSGYTAGTRGFISACALGSQGMRGVWVERHRKSMGRSVFGFAADYHDQENEEESEVGGADKPDSLEGTKHGKVAGVIRGTHIHDIRSSYDLRVDADDLTHCALSEITGTVVLGTRRGELLLL